jgi:hypothetical protein
MMGIIPLTHAVTRTALDKESCGLLQRLAWARNMAATTLACSRVDTVITHTECFFVCAFDLQARLQNLGRVFGAALTFGVEELTTDGW